MPDSMLEQLPGDGGHILGGEPRIAFTLDKEIVVCIDIKACLETVIGAKDLKGFMVEAGIKRESVLYPSSRPEAVFTA